MSDLPTNNVSRLGDVIDFIFAWHLMHRCGKIQGGLPASIHARMVLNVALDFVVGLIPFLGDLADAAFHCNTRNAALLEEYLMKRHGPQNMSMKEKRRSRLEDFSSDEKQALRDAPNRTQPGAVRHPDSVRAPRSDRFGPDLETSGQETGTVRY